jgi:glutathione reductase (NADPH)
MIAEEYRVGGTCVIRGCVPKKLLVYASRFAEEFEDAAGFGWTLAEPSFDWPTLIANKDKEIDRLEAAYMATLERAKVKIVKSRAVLEDAHTIRLLATNKTVRAKHILIATGNSPFHGAKIPGWSTSFPRMKPFTSKLPKRILIRAAAIAVEFAGILMDSAPVTGLSRRKFCGASTDLRAHFAEMERRGIKI